ncbi:methylated-DNA--[protein]-cysteine S-methyltransferase [Halogeometricum sp. S1BR25-6]|uniref:Methylated-DNA--[protein]-cysteine S-methyltransferase n=1 Tax=Halogeometricum salsisoli TaxID=2950536 RepID=A0ABU2GCP9_9EURY|nr:methylated-DNA--[protein]-cysteine S-methyltransferase [Halogeometricum sp. S1BR25-6]MDS0298586.1 methylated-DNA--[protein]-cysteine S-methyltransferase [Halogeometricum sp. S1BR25-6]
MRAEIHGATLELDESYLDADPKVVRERIREYERGNRTALDIEVRYPDTFTGRVMRVMTEIPYGETRTYGELAAELDTSPVAVGQACGRNPIPLVVPCHRVVGAGGRLVGFSAEGGVELKRRLLDGEAANRQAKLAAFE